jgi:hypothetical protein
MSFYDEAMREAKQRAEDEARRKLEPKVDFDIWKREQQINKALSIARIWCNRIGMPYSIDISCDIGTYSESSDDYDLPLRCITARMSWTFQGYDYAATLKGTDRYDYPFINPKLMVSIQVGDRWFPAGTKADIGAALLSEKDR